MLRSSLFVCWAIVGMTWLAAHVTTPPDVVLVLIDDLSYSDLERIPTPRIDSVRGTRFTRAYSMPTCSPTRMNIAYGEFTPRHFRSACVGSDPLHPLAPPILDGSPSLGSRLQDLGYSTCLVGKFHQGTSEDGWQYAPQQNGFDHWLAGGPANLAACGGTGFEDWLRVDDGQLTQETLHATTAQTQAALAWWHSQEGPRFLQLAYHAPHTPIQMPPKYAMPPWYRAPLEPTLRDIHDAMVISLDFELGLFLSTLDSDTVVIIASDNGTYAEVADDPDRAKRTTFEGGIHVPLIISGRENRTAGDLVCLVDLHATILEIAGGRSEAHDSVSLVPILMGMLGSRKFGYAGHVRQDWTVNDQAAFSLTHKLRRPNGPHGLEELYELPDEESPIADESIAEQLRSFLEAAPQASQR